jgi:hypothetical protein
MFKHKGHKEHEGFLDDVKSLHASGEVGSVSRGIVPVC